MILFLVQLFFLLLFLLLLFFSVLHYSLGVTTYVCMHYIVGLIVQKAQLVTTFAFVAISCRCNTTTIVEKIASSSIALIEPGPINKMQFTLIDWFNFSLRSQPYLAKNINCNFQLVWDENCNYKLHCTCIATYTSVVHDQCVYLCVAVLKCTWADTGGEYATHRDTGKHESIHQPQGNFIYFLIVSFSPIYQSTPRIHIFHIILFCHKLHKMLNMQRSLTNSQLFKYFNKFFSCSFFPLCVYLFYPLHQNIFHRARTTMFFFIYAHLYILK